MKRLNSNFIKICNFLIGRESTKHCLVNFSTAFLYKLEGEKASAVPSFSLKREFSSSAKSFFAVRVSAYSKSIRVLYAKFLC